MFAWYNLIFHFIIKLFQTRLTKILAIKKDKVKELKDMNTEAEKQVSDILILLLRYFEKIFQEDELK